ncbi:metallophosphoesterase family protein [Deinococcus altitudinis]|uniref:metallophosphoesterase family protein n=1 Tax=Deinococcus altitudinis TaxID=468914 RepID=UPI00389213EC
MSLRLPLPALLYLTLGLVLGATALAASPASVPSSMNPAHAAPSTHATLRAVLFSDFNGPYGSTVYPSPVRANVERILNVWKPDVVLSAGDLIAGQKAGQSAAQLGTMWAAFERDVRGPLAKAGVPFVFTLGNHDASAAPGFEADRTAASRYWQTRKPAVQLLDTAHYPFWYSSLLKVCPKSGTAGCKSVFIATVDATTDTLRDEAWLNEQLSAPAARGASLRIVLGHLPLYGLSVGRSKAGEVLRGGDRLRALLEDNRVNVYVNGHHAAYYLGRRPGSPLALLASGGIGARDYVGHPGSARSVVSVLDFDLTAGTLNVTPYDADTGRTIPASSLPARIDGYGGSIERVDTVRF